MEIAVCMKQVPAVSSLEIDPVTNDLIRIGAPSKVNGVDLFALEQALKLKEKTGGKVTVISMGPPGAKEVLEDAMGLGADKGYLLCDMKVRGSDTLATAYTLSKTLEHAGPFDVIITGAQTTDGDTGQVPAQIAEFLSYHQSTYVHHIEPYESDLLVKRENFGTEEERIVFLPAVISVTSKGRPLERESSTPKSDVITLTVEDISADENFVGKAGSPTVVAGVYAPKELEKGVLIQKDSAKESVDELIDILLEKKLIG